MFTIEDQPHFRFCLRSCFADTATADDDVAGWIAAIKNKRRTGAAPAAAATGDAAEPERAVGGTAQKATRLPPTPGPAPSAGGLGNLKAAMFAGKLKEKAR